MWRQIATSEQRNSSFFFTPTASSLTQITFTCYLVLPMTNLLLVRSTVALALWDFLVRQRQLLPRANECGVRCPLNKPPVPPSKETRGAPVSVPTGCCLPGIRLKFSLVTIKFLVKDCMWKELERLRTRLLGMKQDVSMFKCSVSVIHY